MINEKEYIDYKTFSSNLDKVILEESKQIRKNFKNRKKINFNMVSYV